MSSNHRRPLAIALAIGMGGTFHYGYQFTVLNPNENILSEFINSSFYSHYDRYVSESTWTYAWTGLVNLQMVGALLGTFLMKMCLDRVSRLKCFYATNICTILSCILQALAAPLNAWEALAVGRFVSGIAQGLHLGVQPVYFSEISPASARGLIGSVTGLTLQAGLVLACVLGLPKILGDTNWPYLFVLECAPTIISLLVLPFVPESPKFLASQGRLDDAERSLRRLGRSEVEAADEIAEIKRELSTTSNDGSTSAPVSFRTIISVPHLRRGVLLGWLVMFTLAFSGVAALSYYSTSILQKSGVSREIAQYGTIAMMGLSCVGAILAGFVLDRFGRRWVMLLSTGGLMVLNLLFFVFSLVTRVHSTTWTGYANIAVAGLMCFVFGIGPCVVAWFLTVELVPQRVRSVAHFSSMLAGRVLTLVAALIFYPVQEAIGEYVFLLHVVPLAVILVCFALLLPETKDKSVLQIVKELGYRGGDNVQLIYTIPGNYRIKPVELI